MLIRREAELGAKLAPLRSDGAPLVLIPTMGDLHEGHLSLVRMGATLGRVVVSIFVNPIQFGPGEDFDAYPRNLDRDLEMLSKEPCAAVFAPEAGEFYRPGDQTFVTVGRIAEPLCGASRPGHMSGVATVVTKLFLIVKPDAAVFGQKDAQQCLLIDRLVQDLRLPVRLAFAPTVRESDGVALSSRNRYLDENQRIEAKRLGRALEKARELLESGERSTERIEQALADIIDGEDCKLDYAELRSVPDLEHLTHPEGRILIAVSAQLGPARLIDNLCLDVSPGGVTEAPLIDASVPEAVVAALAAERERRND